MGQQARLFLVASRQEDGKESRFPQSEEIRTSNGRGQLDRALMYELLGAANLQKEKREDEAVSTELSAKDLQLVKQERLVIETRFLVGESRGAQGRDLQCGSFEGFDLGLKESGLGLEIHEGRGSSFQEATKEALVRG